LDTINGMLLDQLVTSSLTADKDGARSQMILMATRMGTDS